MVSIIECSGFDYYIRATKESILSFVSTQDKEKEIRTLYSLRPSKLSEVFLSSHSILSDSSCCTLIQLILSLLPPRFSSQHCGSGFHSSHREAPVTVPVRPAPSSVLSNQSCRH